MLGKVIFVVTVALVLSEKVTFNNFKIFRIIPYNNDQLEILKKLGKLGNVYDYWTEPSLIFQPVDLMVAPYQLDKFTKLMNSSDLRYELLIKDVQSLIDQENPRTLEDGFSFKRYHTLDEIHDWFNLMAQKYPDKIKVIVGGKSYEGRQIKGVKLSFGKNRPGVFIEGGIHAREWISPATVTYLLDQFLTSQDSQVRNLAETYDWYIFPSFNPDGYVYTHTSNRLWRKTMSRNSSCRGVDGNRNWDHEWMSVGASSDPCSETYAGSKPFSEIETRTMSEYIKLIADKLFAYIAFHSYSQLLMFPYGHTRDHLDNYDDEMSIGLKAVESLAKRYGTKYVTGNIAEAIYLASGSSIDWVKSTLKLPITFEYELRDRGNYGFLLPADQIIPNGQEVLDSILTIFSEASKLGYPKPSGVDTKLKLGEIK